MLRRIKGFTLIELLIVVAIIAILAAIAVPNFLEAQTRSKVTRVKADQRTFATALEAYYIDNNTYPAQDSSKRGGTGVKAGLGVNQQMDQAKLGCLVPTFRIKANEGDPIMTLTTPISYLTSYFPDPFADTKGSCFSYSQTPSGYGTGWIIWSWGPDTDENVNNGDSKYATGGDIVVRNDDAAYPPEVSETFYNAGGVIPSINLIDVTYDPTNGTTSNGDVYRLKQ